MRGPGRHDFTIDDVFVPESHSISLADPSNNPNPLYRPRFFLALADLLFAANALGIARGAIDAMIDMASLQGNDVFHGLASRPSISADASLRPRRSQLPYGARSLIRSTGSGRPLTQIRPI
jgi:indole-3-acetate monooxygenase